MSRYALGNAADAAADRLRILQGCFDPCSRAALAQTGVGAGGRCLEIGAGGGSMAAWLSDVVGPSGRVVATDIDLRRVDARVRALANVVILEHDIVRDPVPGTDFDLIHARLVLLHLPERRDVLARLAGALAPGGWLVVEDFDCGWTPVLAERLHGQAELFTEVHEAFLALLTAAGADVTWGRKLFQAVRELGLDDVAGTLAAQAWSGAGLGIGLHRANVEQLAEELIASGSARRRLNEFCELLGDPGFAVQSYPLVTVRGRLGRATRKAPPC